MSEYYKPKRVKNLYNPLSKELFRISRSKIALFMNCPRCFYLDRRLGIGQPGGFPFSLNSAVDHLLKNEFDGFRAKGETHPLMKEAGIDAVPFKDDRMDEWRDALQRGCTYAFPQTNLLITGAIDDIWVKPEGEIIIVDYKATAKEGEVSLDADWQISYKRQMEIYQWLFRRNGFKVHPTGYFVYCNGDGCKDVFNCCLQFDIKLIPYEGDDSWVEGKIKELYQCLQDQNMPEGSSDCDFCLYRNAVGALAAENKGQIEELLALPRKVKIDLADKEAHEYCEKTWPEMVNQMGFCHAFWGEKKRILKEKYGINWKTPAEENPGKIYD